MPDSNFFPAREHITGCVLAGGRGMRMRQRDKGLQLFFGRPLVVHALERLRVQTAQQCINANRNHAVYAQYADTVFSDRYPDFPGPLAGMHSALFHARTPLVLCVPCDSPFFPMHLACTLHAALEAAHADLAFACTIEAGTLRPHPVFCLLKRSLQQALEQALAASQHKVLHWMRQMHAVEVPFTDDAAFLNINTLEEVQHHDIS